MMGFSRRIAFVYHLLVMFAVTGYSFYYSGKTTTTKNVAENDVTHQPAMSPGVKTSTASFEGNKRGFASYQRLRNIIMEK